MYRYMHVTGTLLSKADNYPIRIKYVDEKGRMLGKTDMESMISFVLRSLPDIKIWGSGKKMNFKK